MRCLHILLLSALILVTCNMPVKATVNEKQSIIIEVDGDPLKHKDYIEKYYPSIDVVSTYQILLNGLALQAAPEKLSKISNLSFVQSTYPVKNYQQNISESPLPISRNTILPDSLHTSKFTGKGVKVGVIDTGIDYTHPDLSGNYAGGYDVVDLDDDPMETTAHQGMPTLHGTHVAGIIAAKGKLTGVAPDAEIYAYRALGPGGSGTSIQVIAAMERALEDDVDIMNLSLGNIVNGPDYPTSIAVNRAVKLGVAVVIANGNNGPNDWTVGAPATASQALAVGALANPSKIPYLNIAKGDKDIQIHVMQGSVPWELKRDYQTVNMNESNDMYGKLVLIKRGNISFYEKAKLAEEAGAIGVLIYNDEAGNFLGSIENPEDPIQIPVASITQADGTWIANELQTKSLFMETAYKQTEKGVAPFSSRGPVTMDWILKPDILAPGTNILSTIPGGYQELQGTSMAAPYVAGAIAVIKEAHPDWSNEQIIGALKTTAAQMQQPDGTPVEPTSQGMGEIQVDQAIQAETIIENPLLSFGRINDYQETKTVYITLENLTDQEKEYVFEMPKKQKGLQWKLPQKFILQGKEKKSIPIELSVTTQQLNNDPQQGWLALQQGTDTFHLPYLFINQTADFPKVMGFGFSLKPFTKDVYLYELYIAKEAKRVEVHLYDPDTLMYNRRLLSVTDLEIGINEGEMKRSEAGESGHFKAIITLHMADGTYESYEEELWID